MKYSRLVILLAVAAAVAAVSCGRPGPQPDPAVELATTASPLSASPTTLMLSWGDEPYQVGLEPAASERAAWGPQSVAMSPDGTVAVLDNHRGRLALFDEGGKLVDSVPVDSMVSDFCFVSAGEIALLNLSALHVEKVDLPGKRLIVYPISPAFKTAVGLDCREEGLVVVTMHQESYTLDAVNPLATRREVFPVRTVRIAS